MRISRSTAAALFTALAALTLACSTGSSDQAAESTTETASASPAATCSPSPLDAEATTAEVDPDADPVLAQLAGTWSSNDGFTKYVIEADGTVLYTGAGGDFQGVAAAVADDEHPNYFEADLEDEYGLVVQLDLSYDTGMDILSVNLDNDGGGDWVDCVRFDG